MSILDIHKTALENKISALHEFLTGYKKNEKIIYGFVEGKDDPVFYTSYIESMIPEDWELKLFSSGGKNNVIRIYDKLDWRTFKKNRICFFVDRDLSEMIPEKITIDKNIYITTGYSVENYVVKPNICVRVLKEIYGFDDILDEDFIYVKSLFEKEIESYMRLMIPVMSLILSWRRSSQKCNLNNINLKKILTINTGVVSEIDSTKTLHIVHKHCGVPFTNNVDLSKEEKDFKLGANYKKYTRGKYLLWFLIEFCNSIHSEAVNMFKSIQKPPKKKMGISHSNAMCVVGGKARFPSSLKTFLQSNYLGYIESSA